MTHPHQAMLDEYQFAIDHLVPTVPAEAKAQAGAAHLALSANIAASEEEIRQAMFETGVAEYPHRHAFAELTASGMDARRAELVLEHVEPEVQSKLKKLLDSQVSFSELVHSQLFETEFTPDERYQIEDALLDADIHIREEFAEAAANDTATYQSLFATWKKREDELLSKIEELAALGAKHPDGKEEIDASVARFREGFLVTEPDPELAEIEHEIAYWIDINAQTV